MVNNTTGSFNTAVGAGQNGVTQGALGNNTTGSNNSALGYQALFSNTTASNNTAVGYQSLYANTTGANNTAIGYNALISNTTGNLNVALGGQDAATYSPLNNNTTGLNNVAIGNAALSRNTTSNNNTAVGTQAGYFVTGSGNVVIGRQAGYFITTGSLNTCIGNEAGIGFGSVTTGSNNTLIGFGAGVSTGGASHQISIGGDCLGIGDNYFTFGKSNGSDRVYNQFTSNASWTRVSDVRIKKEIQDADLGLEFISKLRTVTYKKRAPSEMDTDFPFYKADETEVDHKEKMYGFIAQEVKQALDDVGATDFAGWHQMDNGVQGVSYEMFVVPLIKAVQELKAEVDSLKQQLGK
jgi:hypothetical protein